MYVYIYMCEYIYVCVYVYVYMDIQNEYLYILMHVWTLSRASRSLCSRCAAARTRVALLKVCCSAHEGRSPPPNILQPLIMNTTPHNLHPTPSHPTIETKLISLSLCLSVCLSVCLSLSLSLSLSIYLSLWTLISASLSRWAAARTRVAYW